VIATSARAGHVRFLNLGKCYLTARQVRETQLQPHSTPSRTSRRCTPGQRLGDPFDPEGIERELDTMVAALTDTGATASTFSMPNVVRLRSLKSDSQLTGR
jgi:hypothetical protein